jgi:hypothetical protein
MRTRVRDIKDPDYGLPPKPPREGPIVPVAKMREAFASAFGDPSPQPPGDPLIVVMQLEELSNKLDQIIDRLERIEARQISGLERMEARQKEGLEGIKEAQPTVGSFASSELPAT